MQFESIPTKAQPDCDRDRHTAESLIRRAIFICGNSLFSESCSASYQRLRAVSEVTRHLTAALYALDAATADGNGHPHIEPRQA